MVSANLGDLLDLGDFPGDRGGERGGDLVEDAEDSEEPPEMALCNGSSPDNVGLLGGEFSVEDDEEVEPPSSPEFASPHTSVSTVARRLAILRTWMFESLIFRSRVLRVCGS